MRDAAGKVLSQAGENDTRPDAVLTYTLAADGKYTLTVADRERGGGMDHFYRVNAGALPYISEVFRLGSACRATRDSGREGSESGQRQSGEG